MTVQGSSWIALESALRSSQAIAAAGQYAAAVMHEINNPLEVISNLNYLIMLEPEDAPTVVLRTRQIAEELKNVVRIAHRTLNFYRPADAIVEIDLSVLADAALRVHREKLIAKRARVHERVPGGTTVIGHAGELLQVLSNLIGNSIDALPDQGRLAIRARRDWKEVHLTVADDGHGIPDVIRQQIFNPFFTTKKAAGTGLGLAISKSIVERHEGRIRMWTSQISGRSGTAFRVSLPLRRSTNLELCT